jgi:galactose oxidase
MVLDYSATHGEVTFFPLLHLAPNGQIFQSGPTPKMHYIDPEGGVGNNGTVTQVGSPFTDWYHANGTTIMYDKGKLLTAGGWTSGTNKVSTNRAFTIDLNGPSPVLQITNSMNFARKFHNGVMLPTGEVSRNRRQYRQNEIQ